MTSQMQNKNINKSISPTVLQETLKRDYLIGAGACAVYELAGLDSSAYAAKSVKTDKINAKNKVFSKEYQIMKKLEGEIGFSCAKEYPINEKMEILIMELLGSSLKAKFQHFGGSFTLKIVLMIGYQAIQRLEVLHSSLNI